MMAGYAFMATNIDTIMPISIFKDRMDYLVNERHESPKARNAGRIYLPGEIEWERYRDAVRNGINLPADVVESLQGLAEDLGLNIKYT